MQASEMGLKQADLLEPGISLGRPHRKVAMCGQPTYNGGAVRLKEFW
jgi:hypothetical protein